MIRQTLALGLSALLGLAGTAVAADSLYVDYSARPNPDHLLAYGLNIIHPTAEADLAAGQRLGNRYLAYLSVVEIAADAPYREAALATGIRPVMKNPLWAADLADPADPRWRAFVIEQLARPAAERGFDGFLLDTVDSLRLIESQAPDRAAASRDGLIALIKELRTAFPDKQLVLNRGFDLLATLGRETVDGVLVESVRHTYDPATRECRPVEANVTRTLTAEIQKAIAAGHPVYAVDYLPRAAAPAEVAAANRALREFGAVPFLTTPELDGTVIGGGQVARRLLVLFGYDPKEAESHRIWPADTTTHAILQMPLEWMGYEVDFHDVSKGLPTKELGAEYAGVILDEELEFPYRLEHDFADWLISRIDEGKKVLFLGGYGFSNHHERTRLFTRLGIRATDEVPAPRGPAAIVALDESIMNFETKAAPTRRDFDAVAAPADARVLLGLEVAESPAADSPRHRYDTAYLTSWGGALLSPYLVFEASEETILQHADPFAFLGAIWPAGLFPAPDPTTRDGLRVFYTHVDGDGFSSLSTVDPGKTCAEVLYDRFLKDLPWPITISVVESEIRGHMLSQKADESPQLTELARRILRLPHVQAASHSYSHPYLWMEDDPEFLGLYDSLNLELKLTARYPKIDYRRETLGSIDYISRELAPAGKPADLMLWSGNCRPSPQVLAMLREQGIETMNGGNTILCRRFPGLFGVAPRVAQWDDELQIYAANQNEFLYTEGWVGPTWGGFAQVIETFEMTDGPRRLKPVNVYYHFYSVERPDACAALKKIYDWCRTQELHATTAIQFARITRDSHHTRLVRTGERRWAALNNGQLRTFRLPTGLGYPDLAASEGVTGYHAEKDALYIHTDGRARVAIQLADRPAAQPHVETASAEIEVRRLATDGIDLRVKDHPARLVVAGFRPDSPVAVTTGNLSETHRTDAAGRLAIEAPAAASLSLKPQL
ncbi:MAG: endo alpha-1,4 polygalactosaminidase [Verrucomicrobiales bacterium]|nr:endo alpha-1,4 polygalactosaminidase [Verrucomicrobiales bacterium]